MSKNMENPNLAKGKGVVEEICWIKNVSSEGKAYNACSKCEMCEVCNKVHNARVDDEKIINLTDGETRKYDEFSGYMSVIAPGTITVDLEKVEAVQTIQILLWDNCGYEKTENCNRLYQYRLLVSEDCKNWTVLFDTYKDGYCGWQVFDLSSPMSMRYIRFHALTVNDKTPPPFMLVALEAYAKEPQKYDELMATLNVDLNVEPIQAKDKGSDTRLNEISHHKLSNYFLAVKKKLDGVCETLKVNRMVGLAKATQTLKESIDAIMAEVVAYEKEVGEIKDKILGKANEEVVQNRKLEMVNAITFILGIVSLGLAIYSELLK